MAFGAPARLPPCTVAEAEIKPGRLADYGAVRLQALLDQVDAAGAAVFFVDHSGENQITLQDDAGPAQRSHGDGHAGKNSLCINRSPPVNPPAFYTRNAWPGHIIRRNRIEMAVQQKGAAAAAAGQPGHDIAAAVLDRNHLRADPFPFKKTIEIFGYPGLLLLNSPVAGDGNQFADQRNDLHFIKLLLNSLVKVLHGRSPRSLY